MIVTLTEKAAEQAKKYKEENEAYLRIGVVGGGCSGFEYMFKWDDQFDEAAILRPNNTVYRLSSTRRVLCISKEPPSITTRAWKSRALPLTTPMPSSLAVAEVRSKPNCEFHFASDLQLPGRHSRCGNADLVSGRSSHSVRTRFGDYKHSKAGALGHRLFLFAIGYRPFPGSHFGHSLGIYKGMVRIDCVVDWLS